MTQQEYLLIYNDLKDSINEFYYVYDDKSFGCIMEKIDKGIIFIDSRLSHKEALMVLAHEIGHRFTFRYDKKSEAVSLIKSTDSIAFSESLANKTAIKIITVLSDLTEKDYIKLINKARRGNK